MINFSKFKMPAIRSLLAFIAFPLILIVGCKKKFDEYYGDTGPASVSVYDKLKQDTSFSIFAEGLDRVGLVKQINSGGLFTVFAPINNAFRTYLATKGYASINDVPVDTLYPILNFHITNNEWYYYVLQQQFKTYNSKLYLTRGGKFLTIDVTAADTLKVNGIPVINALRDISSGNAVVHGIGTVLIPRPNLEQLLANDSYFRNSTFYKLMQVVADSSYDRLNSYDRNGDSNIDSIFNKTYSLLTNVYTSIEFKQNTNAVSQGGDVVFTNILMPIDDSLNAFIAPALARISGSATNKIAALSPTYVQAVLLPYFIADTSVGFTMNRFLTKPAGTNYLAVNGQIVPVLNATNFVRSDVQASNGMVHLINRNFPQSDRLVSVVGQASQDPDLSMFMEALQKSGVFGTYATAGKAATLFAPTNAAFIAEGFDVKKMVLNGVQLTTTQFQNIIKNHIIDGTNLATNVAVTGTFNTLYANTNTLIFTNGGTTATVTTNLGTVANVTLPFAYKASTTTNGYLYKVDKLLIPR
ncbi:MAG: fasciclin domain-containing protein [Deinococcales bacterium]|nr:fasciclin domain-containing protein [Chitinophagaceae bacterium]